MLLFRDGTQLNAQLPITMVGAIVGLIIVLASLL
jgi:hypothetical protein